MRHIAMLGCALLLVGCSKKDEAPAVDTTPVAAVEPAAPPAMTLESVAGKWNMRVMAMDNDSTLTTHTLTASADPAGWSLLQPTGEVVQIRNVAVSGDSVTAQAGPFSSGVRKGMKVRHLDAVYRLQGDKLTGMVTARYETSGPDSVRQFRLEGTKQ